MNRSIALSTYPTNSGEQPFYQLFIEIISLFGLSAHKVCHALAVANKAVVSYTTFSPFPKNIGFLVVYFLWHWLSNNRRQLFAYPLGSMLLFAVRTFLSKI